MRFLIFSFFLIMWIEKVSSGSLPNFVATGQYFQRCLQCRNPSPLNLHLQPLTLIRAGGGGWFGSYALFHRLFSVVSILFFSCFSIKSCFKLIFWWACVTRFLLYCIGCIFFSTYQSTNPHLSPRCVWQSEWSPLVFILQRLSNAAV